MNTVYLLTKIFTYPGAFLKGFWEHVTCRILKLEVTDRHYLAANEACGHAAHTPAMTPAKAYLLSLLPYIAQRVLGWIFLGASVAPVLLFNLRDRDMNPLLLLEYAALYLGLSIICNSFPQWADAKRQWRLFYGKPTPEELGAVEEDAQAEAEAEAEVEAEPEVEAELEAEAEPEIEAEPEAEPIPSALPKFAGPAAKIILAPCNAYFLAGAWLEKMGIPAIAAIVITVAVLIFR